jgi:hypothetical protein
VWTDLTRTARQTKTKKTTRQGPIEADKKTDKPTKDKDEKTMKQLFT